MNLQGLPSTSMVSPLLLQDAYFTSPIQNPSLQNTFLQSPSQKPAVVQTQPQPLPVTQTVPPNSPRFGTKPQLMQQMKHQAALPSDQLAETLAQRSHEAVYNLIRALPEHLQFEEIAGSVKSISDGQDAVREIQHGVKILSQRLQASEERNKASKPRAQHSEDAQQLVRENATLQQQFIQASIYHNIKVKALEDRIRHLESINATYQKAMEAMSQLDQEDEAIIIRIQDEEEYKGRPHTPYTPSSSSLPS